MSDWWKIIVTSLVNFLLFYVGSEWWKKILNKDRESLEVSKLELDGNKAIIEAKINIDSIVRVATDKLSKEIAVLKEIQLQQAIENIEDKKESARIISELRKNMDEQFELSMKTNEHLQTSLKLRNDCLAELTKIKEEISKNKSQ